jgi:glyoxalase family protein
LYEIATLGPGFTVDEELGRLGRDLKLPPWEEQHRQSIEAALPPIVVPGG